MNFIESILDAIKNNSKNMTSMDMFRFRQLIQTTINSFIISSKKSKEAREEFSAITTVSVHSGLEITENMNRRELMLTEKCIELRDALNDNNLDESERKRITEELNETYGKLNEYRKKHDNSKQFVGKTLKDANKVVKNIKTDQYIKDKRKRKSILKPFYYGKDDPFYDGLKAIYGEEGLYGYRKERMEDFKNIAEKDVDIASHRYKAIASALTGVKTILQVGVFIASWKFFPSLALGGGWDPITYGVLSAIGTEFLFKIPEWRRTKYNSDILHARIRIAEDLGLIKKDQKFNDYQDEK